MMTRPGDLLTQIEKYFARSGIWLRKKWKDPITPIYTAHFNVMGRARQRRIEALGFTDLFGQLFAIENEIKAATIVGLLYAFEGMD